VDNQVQTPFQISDTADKNMRLAEVMGPEDKRANVTYADLATQLFELIAKVVEVRQPVVETFYGM
jgi:hypothetical protein